EPGALVAGDLEVLRVGVVDHVDLEVLVDRGLDARGAGTPLQFRLRALEGLHHLQVVQVHRGGADAGIDHDGEWCQQDQPAQRRDTQLLVTPHTYRPLVKLTATTPGAPVRGSPTRCGSTSDRPNGPSPN